MRAGRGLLAKAALLLLLLLLAALDGATSNPVQDPPQHRVDGAPGEWVSLPVPIPPGKDVAQIEWDFQAESGPARVIAEFTPGEWERPNPEDRFGQRLEKADGTTLRIEALEKEDSGVYTAHVRFKTAEVQEHAFVLRVSGESGTGWVWMPYLCLCAFLIWIVIGFRKCLMKWVTDTIKKLKNGYRHPNQVKPETLSEHESNAPIPPREEPTPQFHPL